MCPVTGPVVLSKFQPSSGQSTIALSTTVKPEDADSDVTLCTGVCLARTFSRHKQYVDTTYFQWVLEKNADAMYALSFGGQYIVNCDKKLQICQDAKHTECFIWKFIDADKSHVVYWQVTFYSVEPGSLSFVFTNQHTEKGGNDKNGMDCRQQESAGESLSATSTVSVAAN